MATGSLLETDRDYPASDGKPMAETDLHRQVMVDLIDMHQHRYRDRPDVCVRTSTRVDRPNRHRRDPRRRRT